MIRNYSDVEWSRLVSEAKRNLESKCPLLEDEVMVYMDERMKRMEKVVRTAKAAAAGRNIGGISTLALLGDIERMIDRALEG